MSQITYFPDNLFFDAEKHAFFKAAGLTPQPYHPSLAPQTTILLLATPIKTEEETFVSPESVWKRYFTDLNPAAKIIQTGYSENGPNYLHWFFLPENFISLLNSSVKVTDWEPQETYGEKLDEVWERFWKGHNFGGFKDSFEYGKRDLSSQLYNLKTGESCETVRDYVTNSEVVQRMQNIRIRWDQYRAYFKATPFYNAFEKIDEIIQTLGPFWPEMDTEIKLINILQSTKNKLDEIKEILTKLAHYIHPDPMPE